jgi:hypothetical protein
MKKTEAFDSIVEHASPYITLSYVIDEEGVLLARFNFHPQMDEIELDLDVVSSNNNQIIITADDVRAFAERLVEFADVADTVVGEYNKKP